MFIYIQLVTRFKSSYRRALLAKSEVVGPILARLIGILVHELEKPDSGQVKQNCMS